MSRVLMSKLCQYILCALNKKKILWKRKIRNTSIVTVTDSLLMYNRFPHRWISFGGTICIGHQTICWGTLKDKWYQRRTDSRNESIIMINNEMNSIK